MLLPLTQSAFLERPYPRRGPFWVQIAHVYEFLLHELRGRQFVIGLELASVRAISGVGARTLGLVFNGPPRNVFG